MQRCSRVLQCLAWLIRNICWLYLLRTIRQSADIWLQVNWLCLIIKVKLLSSGKGKGTSKIKAFIVHQNQAFILDTLRVTLHIRSDHPLNWYPYPPSKVILHQAIWFDFYFYICSKMLIFKIAGLPDKNMFRIRFLPICASDSRCKIKRNFLIGDSDFSPSIHRIHGHKLAIY